MGSGKDRRWVFTNEIRHQTAVKAEQLHNQANRVSRVDSTSGCEVPTLGYWVIHPLSVLPSVPTSHPWNTMQIMQTIHVKQDTCSTITPCIKHRGVCLRRRLLVFMNLLPLSVPLQSLQVHLPPLVSFHWDKHSLVRSPDHCKLANKWVWQGSWTLRGLVEEHLAEVSSASSLQKWKH